ncbi:MAG: hypothetical protein PVI43_00610 [Candidatus Bathyarchaeota archaeon]|jgi:hypothetical protein
MSIKRTLYELAMGKRAYLKKGKKKKVKTVRTKAVESSAKKNYGVDLTAELAALRKRGQGK